MAQRKIKVLYPGRQNKVLYANILITQAFYCIPRLRSVLHLCYYTWTYFTGLLYFPKYLLTFSNKNTVVTLV